MVRESIDLCLNEGIAAMPVDIFRRNADQVMQRRYFSDALPQIVLAVCSVQPSSVFSRCSGGFATWIITRRKIVRDQHALATTVAQKPSLIRQWAVTLPRFNPRDAQVCFAAFHFTDSAFGHVSMTL